MIDDRQRTIKEGPLEIKAVQMRLNGRGKFQIETYEGFFQPKGKHLLGAQIQIQKGETIEHNSSSNHLKIEKQTKGTAIIIGASESNASILSGYASIEFSLQATFHIQKRMELGAGTRSAF